MLGYAARFAHVHKVSLYALSVEGNHIQATALFPEGNRADFMRDFNSSTARAVARHTPQYPGGRLWGRRYSAELLPDHKDIEEQFFYTVLRPVQDGLVEKISDYPGYNCFHDAIWGIKRKYKVIFWAKYNGAKRHNPDAKIKDYTETVELRYERFPGYEHMTQKEYAIYMQQELERRRVEIVQKRYKQGLGFAGKKYLLQVRPGSTPKNTKTSSRYDHRPRVLSKCPARLKEALEQYFYNYFAYKEASLRYRNGELDVKFPFGCYKPYLRGDPPLCDSELL